MRIIGKIKMISHVVETYQKREVIEGELKTNDMTQIGKVACSEINAGPCDLSHNSVHYCV